MNLVEATAEILRLEGIKFLVAFASNPLIEECAKVGIRPILCRQERVGVGIADGLSRTTNGENIGVFAMQNGPGAENAFPGAAQAFSDNVPVLFLPGGPPADESWGTPYFNSVESYTPVTKWAAQIGIPEQLQDRMRRAFYQLRTGKPGPVLLETPYNIFSENLDGELKYIPVKGNKIAPDPLDVREVAKVLLSAKDPVIHAGQGCLYAKASESLVEIAELLQAPVMTTLPGKSAFPENHPLSLGAASIATTKQVVHFIDKADLVFGVGCSFTSTNYGKSIPSGKIMVHSTNSENDINKDYNADYAVLGDARLVLEALIHEIKDQTHGEGKRTVRDIASEIQEIKSNWISEWMPQLTSEEVPMNQYRIIWDLLHNVDVANTIITHDAGSPREQVVPFWETVAPRTYLGWGKSTQLGHGLGLIMGAKLAEPDKLCINVMGDAAIGMVGMDIETAVRNKIGILTIVFNNGAMAMERPGMTYATEAYGAVYQGGNYSKLAESLGANSVRVQKPNEFIPALRNATEITKSGQPFLIECIVKENTNYSVYDG